MRSSIICTAVICGAALPGCGPLDFAITGDAKGHIPGEQLPLPFPDLPPGESQESETGGEDGSPTKTNNPI
jgi:hypothetical protein